MRRRDLVEGEQYIVRDSYLGGPYIVTLLKKGRFRALCYWTTFDIDEGYEYPVCGWKPLRKLLMSSGEYFNRLSGSYGGSYEGN